MIQQKISLFQCLTSVTSRAVDMDEVVRLIQYDSSVAEKTEKYRTMVTVLGKEKADEEVKRKVVPAFSVGVLFDGNGRGAANVLGFTGLALCDIDHVGGALDEAFAKLKDDPHTLMAYRTISGDGLRVIYRYEREGGTAGSAAASRQEPLTATPWRAAVLKGNGYFARLVGHDYDPQCLEYSRLSGVAHDGEVFVNWQAAPFVVTDDEIVAANFDGSGEKGKPRREYAAGSQQVTVDEAWPRVEQTLQRRQMVYQSGHHHDYVMHAAFLFNRYGVDRDELLEWAAQAWSDYRAKERKATICSCYKRTQEHGTWRLNQQGRKSKETSMIALPEIREWLREHVEVVYNMVTDQTMYRVKQGGVRQSDCSDPQPPNLGGPGGAGGSEKLGGEWAQLDERVLCSIRHQIAADTGKRVLKQDVRDVLRSDFARVSHPVREYIEALPPWDGRDRVEQLSSWLTVEAVHSDETADDARCLMEWAMHKWLVACVATWMSDLSANHEILVLIGKQGIYKTTFFRHLLPPPLRQYFWENAHNSFSTKDDHLALTENCLVEIEEIDMQNPRDISELKALATSEYVKERRPYAQFREQRHRLASFCGSGNQQRFLSDDTGNRRWLCFLVSHIDDPRQWSLDYDQLYAQLRDELRQGFCYWFDARDQRRIEHQNEAFRIESDEEQLISMRLRPPRVGEKVTLMNAASISQFINGGSVGRGISTRKIGMAMRRLGFKLLKKEKGNFYSVFQIPIDQIQATIAMDSSCGGNDLKNSAIEADLPF